jgi:hypothetical protein
MADRANTDPPLGGGGGGGLFETVQFEDSTTDTNPDGWQSYATYSVEEVLPVKTYDNPNDPDGRTRIILTWTDGETTVPGNGYSFQDQLTDKIGERVVEVEFQNIVDYAATTQPEWRFTGLKVV